MKTDILESGNGHDLDQMGEINYVHKFIIKMTKKITNNNAFKGNR